jgi:putative transposase
MLIRHFHRRNLPHLYYNEGIYFVTYCLYDSVHSNKLRPSKYHFQNEKNLDKNQFRESFKKYDALLDKPSDNIQYLRNPDILNVCKSSLHFYDKKEYNLFCYCIMPNHVHLVFDLLSKEKNVGNILGSIKKYSARRANKILHRFGHFWQTESYDRLVRDDTELYFILRYVLLNPVNAGLVKNWKDWQGIYCKPSYLVID